MFPDDRDPIDGMYVSIFGSVGSLTERETTQIKLLLTIGAIGVGSLNPSEEVANLVAECGALDIRMVKLVDTRINGWATKMENTDPKYGLSGPYPRLFQGSVSLACHWVRAEAERRGATCN